MKNDLKSVLNKISDLFESLALVAFRCAFIFFFVAVLLSFGYLYYDVFKEAAKIFFSSFAGACICGIVFECLHKFFDVISRNVKRNDRE